MKLVLCVDDRFGMMFNGRRQTQDRILKDHLAEIATPSGIWVSSYTAKQFKNSKCPITVSNDLTVTPNGCYCLVEDEEIPTNDIEEILLVKWNRTYPADKYFDRDILNEFELFRSEEIIGSSHDKITLEFYRRTL